MRMKNKVVRHLKKAGCLRAARHELSAHQHKQTKTTKTQKVSRTMKLSSLTYLAFETNAVLDAYPGLKLPFAEIHTAAEENRLIEYLAQRFGDKADLSLFLAYPEEQVAVNLALADVAG